MNTETTGAEALAGGEAIATQVETSEATTEQPVTENAETDQAEPETGDDAAAQPKKKHWAHERIDELTRQRREAERQAEYWRAKTSQPVDTDALDYEDGIAERIKQSNRQEQADTAAEAAQRLAAEAYGYRVSAFREKFGDYDSVVTQNPNLPITPNMRDLIMDSDVGPDVAYHLGKNPHEAARIAALPERLQAKELGKLEVILTAPKPQPKVPATPVRTVTGVNSGGSKDPAAMTMAEYVAARNSGQI